MKLRTFYALCFLCLSRSLAAEEDPTWNSSQSFDPEKLQLYLDESNPRDKRALGLILTGLAQVFGYDVSPIQVASLPNSEPPTVIALSANETQQGANESSSTTASPRQRETIRFTGVLNFGNNGSLLSQLQEYEQVFHGTSNGTGPMANATSPTSTEPPVDIRRPLAPLLVNIPLPVMPQPPLPEIPPQDIKLSYPPTVPIRYVPVRGQQEMVNRQNASSVKQRIESRPIQSVQEVKSSRVPVGFASTSEPPWKKEYEERLAELERKQAEHAEKLRQQERYRNRVRDDDYSNEDGRWNHGKEDEDTRCIEKEKDSYSDTYSSAEEDGSSESYQDHVKRPNESQEDKDIRDYEDQKPFRQQEDFPASDNYTNVQFNEPLPITGDHEHQWPEQLRNSYGELLNSSELNDGFANFFNQFKDSSLYTVPGSQGSRENLKEEDYSRSKENEDESGEKREEVDLSARNKYEEYSLEDDGDTKRKDDERNIEKDLSDRTDKLPDKFLPSGKNRSILDDQKSREEVNYSSFMPLIVPARYVSAPEEVKKAKARLATIEKPSRIKVASRDSKKVQSKESRSPKKENLKPKPSILDRQLPKKLHEGEQKDFQLWPPPFDFVLDGTIQTDVAPGKLDRRYVKSPFAVRKVETRNERIKEVQKIERHTTAQSPGQRSRGSSKNNSYEKFKEGLKPHTVSSRQSAESVNRENRTQSEVAGAKESRRRVPQSAETTDHWDRYKYTTSDNYLATERPNIEVVRSTQQHTPGLFSNKFEGLKRSTEKIEPVLESYFTERSPVDNSKMTDQNAREFQVVMPGFVPPTFERPAPGYFHFPAMNYQLAEKVDNERAIGIIAPRQDAYRHAESFTKYPSEPENRGEKVADGSYSTGTHDADILGQKVELSRPMGYVDYVRML
ncbi:uncharacterized protein LOC143209845 [Lasioglossum baleicum]|uniref:uncharacterized protein LOC143209845 n=1 Tax=Lasioglossum baleicum TaxID=434251 RepID=UPI003FCE416D